MKYYIKIRLKVCKMEDIDLAWEKFNNGTYDIELDAIDNEVIDVPKSGELYISTKTIITYLNITVDIEKTFWNLPMIDYYDLDEGILKKQIKLTSTTKEKVDMINERLKTIKYYDQYIIKDIDNLRGKKKYKNVQKLSIGVSNKDLLTTKKKKKGAFYNCIAMIMRVNMDDTFKEVHIKMFNTGKLEIPGIQDDRVLFKALNILKSILNDTIEERSVDIIDYNSSNFQTVLINSNFNCGYFINRITLHNILKTKYNIISIFDPCSYPGIQSKFYYNKMKETQDGVCRCSTKCSKGGSGCGEGECLEISFMIFRTGSILIVGNCEEYVLKYIYDFLVDIFKIEFSEINNGIITDRSDTKDKAHKSRTVTIEV